MKKNYDLLIMETLAGQGSTRDAVKFLGKNLKKYNKSPAELMREGKGDVVLRLIKKTNAEGCKG